jgi:hypothetical protein
MDELADHLHDVMEDEMNRNTDVARRLGEPDQVAEATVVAYRERTFFGRHPSAVLWVFGISPIVAMTSVFVLACVGVGALAAICQRCGVPLADQKPLGCVDPTVVSWSVSALTTILPGVLLTIAYCLLAKRLNISKRWMLASCWVVSLVAMLPVQSILLSDMPGQSRWSLGIALPPGLLQCVQMIVPLAVGAWFAWRPRKQPPQGDRLRMAA